MNYNGNYPKVIEHALIKRGCWKFLNTNMEISNLMKKRKSVSSCSNFDSFVIENCDLIWRPVNFDEIS